MDSWSVRIPEFAIAGFGFLLHFLWEMLQVPWFAGMLEASHGSVVWLCVQATVGDVVILIISFWLASACVRYRSWLLKGERRPAGVLVAVGLAFTIAFEWFATGPLERWSYAETMPVVPGIGVGLTPILQWILLPPLVLWLARHHMLGAMVRRPVA